MDDHFISPYPTSGILKIVSTGAFLILILIAIQLQ